jgi:hypothetical protein
VVQSLLFRLRIRRDERQGGGIDAESQTRRGRAVIEQVAQVRPAAGAEDLCAIHPKAVVFHEFDIGIGNGREEAWPASAGIEFRIGTEQQEPAGGAPIDALAVVIPQGVMERRFGPMPTQDGVLLGGEQFTPVGIGMDNFIGRGRLAGRIPRLRRQNRLRCGRGRRGSVSRGATSGQNKAKGQAQ